MEQLSQQINDNWLLFQFGGLIGHLILGLSLFIIAKKENMSNGWWGFVPILNLILTAQIADQNPWLWLILLVPCVGWLILPYMWYHVGNQRGGKGIWGILMVIPCFFWISPLVIAFTD